MSYYKTQPKEKEKREAIIITGTFNTNGSPCNRLDKKAQYLQKKKGVVKTNKCNLAFLLLGGQYKI